MFSAVPQGARLGVVNVLFYRAIRFVVLHRRPGLSWLATPPLVYLGSISYALYMFHGFVIEAYERAFGHIPASQGSAVGLRFFLVLATSLAISTLSRYAVELPAQRLRRFVIRPEVSDARVITDKVEAQPEA